MVRLHLRPPEFIMGDYLSGRASRLHREGRGLNPSIAHISKKYLTDILKTMGDLKEFTPSTKQNPKPEKPADVVPNEEFQRKSAEKEAERREKNPLDISEIFDLIKDGK